MLVMSRDEVTRDIAIALAVMAPPVQFGRGRKLPLEGDRERHRAAELIVEHFERREGCVLVQAVAWAARSFIRFRNQCGALPKRSMSDRMSRAMLSKAPLRGG
jgi:hypothetical protein